MMKLENLIKIDSFCFLVLIAFLWTGPEVVEKIAITILVVVHTLMLYKYQR